MPRENWCECEDHFSLDFSWVMAFYRNCFIPDGWGFQYTTIAEAEKERSLYLTGTCSQCGGDMCCAISIPGDLTYESLFEDVYQIMLKHRPYDDRDSTGAYHGRVPQRSEWYWRQDQLNRADFIEQFAALFLDKDQQKARCWAEEHIPTPPVCREPVEDRFEDRIGKKIRGLRTTTYYYL